MHTHSTRALGVGWGGQGRKFGVRLRPTWVTENKSVSKQTTTVKTQTQTKIKIKIVSLVPVCLKPLLTQTPILQVTGSTSAMLECSQKALTRDQIIGVAWSCTSLLSFLFKLRISCMHRMHFGQIFTPSFLYSSSRYMGVGPSIGVW